MLTPRPYQIEAVKAVRAAWSRGVQRPAVVLPTGSGKTVVLAHLIKLRHEGIRGDLAGRTLVIAHRTELIEQAADKIRDVAPELRVGIVKAQQNETRADVVVASVQTLRDERRRRMLADVGLIVIDECHHAPSESYLQVLGHYGAWGDVQPVGQDHRAVAVGFTATMVRSDQKALGDVWQEVVYSRSIAEMIQSGYLVRPRGVRVEVGDLDLGAVKMSRGDYSDGDLGRAMTDSMAPGAIAKAILEHASGRDDCGIIFAPTVESARIIGEAVSDVGARTALVWGAMPPEDRRDALSRFKAGDLDWLSSVGVLTEGTDLPRAKVAVIARPTKSRGLYVQCAGRVLRPYPGKSEALILDVVGATAIHSLMSPIVLFGEKGAEISEKVEGDESEELDEEDVLPASGDAVDFDRAVYADGPLVSHQVDLFAGSASDWLRTRGGIWFLPAGERFIAIVPGAAQGTWDVSEMHAKQRGTGRWVVQGVRDMAYAMAYAEGAITAVENMTAARGRPWKLKKPTEAQASAAQRMGIAINAGMTSGEVSQLMTTIIGTRRIDPCVPEYARGR